MNKIKKTFSFIVGTSLALALVSVTAIPFAQADTNILVGSNLTIGSTGQNVVVLQGLLSELGYLNIPAGISMGYFGSMTKSSLARYQQAQNVTPSVGYFGPVTKVAMHKDFSSHNWLALLGW